MRRVDLSQRARENGAHYLQTRSRARREYGGIGAKVMVASNGRHQWLEEMPTRGFESAVDPRLHFGLGSATQVDSLTVVGPTPLSAADERSGGSTITLSQTDARTQPPNRPTAKPLFSDITNPHRARLQAQRDPFFDYDREPLMPHLLSTEDRRSRSGSERRRPR